MLIPSALSFLVKHKSLLPQNGNVVDLGDQLLFDREHAAQCLPEISHLLRNNEVSDYECVSMIYKYLGLGTRECIDYSENASIRINLNYTSLSIPGIDSKFDLVTNQGFSEHVFNQFSVFECIHSICKPNGFMMHVLPCQGWADGEGWGHGFFQYQPNFFRHLATANKYKLIDIQLSPFSPSEKLLDFLDNIYPAISNPHRLDESQKRVLGIGEAQYASILVLFQKPPEITSFVPPHE